MSQAMILDRWQSITSADILINLSEIPSGLVALFVSKEYFVKDTLKPFEDFKNKQKSV